MTLFKISYEIKDIPEDNFKSSCRNLVKKNDFESYYSELHSPIAVVEMAIAATPPPSYITK